MSGKIPFVELVKRRPKIALRRTKDRALQNAIKAYDLNRRTEAEAKALEYIRQLVGRG